MQSNITAIRIDSLPHYLLYFYESVVDFVVLILRDLYIKLIFFVIVEILVHYTFITYLIERMSKFKDSI